MEVMVPMAPAKNFHADKSADSTPYVSAPSSPRGFDYLYHYTSAPASPTRITAIYSSIPFQWGDKPDDPSYHDADHQMGNNNNNNNDDYDFEFNFSGQLQKGALPPELTAADELFEEGKIRTLKQPRSQPSQSRRGSAGEDVLVRSRGRGPSANSSRARSLSPLRGGGIGVNGKDQGSSRKDNTSSSSSSSSSSIVSFLRRSSGNGSKKWRLRDLLLFRSASEGRVTGRGSKDPLRKYTANIAPPLSSKPSSGGEDSKSSSFRSTDSGGSVRRGALSPHEMHYTANRAASEELRKKTPLPYRQGLFGCLRFNPAVTAISRGFNTQSFSRG
ncbi:hypothetical protein J5N97_009774 [Dioscorea zingiberensis]|uniref:Uncharacterized protein n=1 Tax=Dioscorea zingiberensis TaxID=325984 RepID=A0A9D5CYZ6_9LILI|nr:hypothetical protein J5N97_009774 [Dioscorea zingiberensis]